ncbi:MAG: GGDEF domain-containing protein [Blautia sp.]|nr:GGDEF domain-containing protein [Blautia sp.]
MISYYSSIILLCWAALGVLCVLVSENDRIPAEEKRSLYMTYLVIAAAALAEWIGVQLDGREGIPLQVLAMVKCADYALTPMAGGMLVWGMKEGRRWKQLLLGLLISNTVFQIVACFAGWMVAIDEHNHYTHGPLYFVYVLVYLTAMVLVVIGFISYGRNFRQRNQKSLYMIMLMVFFGILMQEFLGREFRTAYISMTLGAALLYIHYSEFLQMRMDEEILKQRVQIDTDPLTGTYSRYAYSQALKGMDASGRIPEDLVIFAIDINELKTINDTLGHDAGDELICGSARCIQEVLGEYGRCYRTGGDEFVVLANMDRQQAEEAVRRLDQVTSSWKGHLVKEVALAAGFIVAADFEGLSAEKLVREADFAMYAAKSEYYRRTGKDRRRKR